MSAISFYLFQAVEIEAARLGADTVKLWHELLVSAKEAVRSYKENQNAS